MNFFKAFQAVADWACSRSVADFVAKIVAAYVAMLRLPNVGTARILLAIWQTNILLAV
jgi:hypothetical protein